MKIGRWVIISLFCCTIMVGGCSFLDPITKTDAQGNTIFVAKGSQYMETAQGVLNSVSGFPIFGVIASGIAGLLGVGVAVANNMARKRSTALAATVQGVSAFADNYDTVKSSVVNILTGANQTELASKIQTIFDKNQSLKTTIQKVANSKGIESFLNWFVQKTDSSVVKNPSIIIK